MEGGRAGARRLGRNGRTGPGSSLRGRLRAGRGSTPALATRSPPGPGAAGPGPRGARGHRQGAPWSCIIHRRAARPPAPRLPPSRSPRGLRAEPRSGSEEPSQYCGSSASDCSGEAGVRSLGGGRRALRLGGVRGEGEAGSHGPKRAQAGREACSSRRTQSLASLRPPALPSFFPSVSRYLGGLCSGRGVGHRMANKVGTVLSLIELNLQRGWGTQIKSM